ncbi:glycosyltransferase family 2 protein [Leifsonia sp. Root4]|uniref:glycosyltransferase family 2 protein n=1 Tax=Leifsonia sp. Root4 TaxID=1736525 RepID=UPI0009E99256|nr:glycosyltransferase family 2 protein [Leifsonia sp. Root4]
MKVFVQIPCLNEEGTIAAVLESIPEHIPGVDEIEILIIDDGSSDRTIEVARAHGVTHFVTHVRNMGLARSFADGVHYALTHGADIVVNTDGDNQYPQSRIADLVLPILRGEAEIVIGDRQTSTIAHFSPFKKLLQRVGSSVVNFAASTNLPDAASGFRAYSRSSLMRLNVLTQFSYCMETIIQAGHKRLKIVSVPIETNAKTRESRLFKSTGQHVLRSAQAITRSYLMFKPFVLFAGIGTVMLIGALIPFVRYLVLLMLADGSAGQHLQSLLLGVALLIGALLSYALGVIAELLKMNRILIEDNLERSKLLLYGAVPRHDVLTEAHLPAETVVLTAPSVSLAESPETSSDVPAHDATFA